MRTRTVVAAIGALLLSTAADAAEIKVLSTQAVEGAYRELVPQFEKASGHKMFVGSIIASGEVENSFQQVSELAHYPGIVYMGPLPADIQDMTVFSSGMQIGAKSVDAAKAWITFLISPAAGVVFRSKSMEPAGV